MIIVKIIFFLGFLACLRRNRYHGYSTTFTSIEKRDPQVQPEVPFSRSFCITGNGASRHTATIKGVAIIPIMPRSNDIYTCIFLFKVTLLMESKRTSVCNCIKMNEGQSQKTCTHWPEKFKFLKN